MSRQKRSTSRQHEKLVNQYKDETYLSNFLNTELHDVYTEMTLSESLNINSPKTPDIIALDDNECIYVGEIKGRYTPRNVTKATNQVSKYYNIIARRVDVDVIPFIVVGNYREVF